MEVYAVSIPQALIRGLNNEVYVAVVKHASTTWINFDLDDERQASRGNFRFGFDHAEAEFAPHRLAARRVSARTPRFRSPRSRLLLS
jgi:hypothetical protein